MDKIIREMTYWLQENKDTASIEEVIQKREMMGEEYNRYTEPYRNMMAQMDDTIKEKKQNEINNCVHVYIRESGYYSHHNFICNKCGHEC
jgi:hypothetical protein|tara:strand:+ start:71 stop:340 length:270 start_codon:yes stop_codon:yes gene_type:complete